MKTETELIVHRIIIFLLLLVTLILGAAEIRHHSLIYSRLERLERAMQTAR